jgi:hypothetical protein
LELLITVVVEEILCVDVFDEFFEGLERKFGIIGGGQELVSVGITGGLKGAV